MFKNVYIKKSRRTSTIEQKKSPMTNQHRTIQSSRDLGAFIYDARNQRSLTQEALARKANVSRSWLIGLEQGKRPRAEMDKILNLFRALDISLLLQMAQTHEMTGENLTPQDNPAEESSDHKAPSPDSQNATSDTISAPWESLLGNTFKNAVTPHLDTSRYFKTYLSDQAARPISDANQILRNVAETHTQNIAKVIGTNTPSIEKALRANIPNFGQASGITRALDREE